MKRRVERPLRISCVREVRLMTEELNFHDMDAFHKRSVSSGGNPLRFPLLFQKIRLHNPFPRAIFTGNGDFYGYT